MTDWHNAHNRKSFRWGDQYVLSIRKSQKPSRPNTAPIQEINFLADIVGIRATPRKKKRVMFVLSKGRVGLMNRMMKENKIYYFNLQSANRY